MLKLPMQQPRVLLPTPQVVLLPIMHWQQLQIVEKLTMKQAALLPTMVKL